MDWRWILGVVVFGTIGLSLYLQILTHKHRTYTSSRRFRRRDLFHPDWGRGKPDRPRRRGIRIGR
jgi:hypothetical protein